MPDSWSEYDHWNDALTEVIFARSDEVRPVYLHLEDTVVDELAALLGLPSAAAVDGLCDVVRSTLDRSAGPARIFHYHDARLREWLRDGRATPPPIIGVLACFSLAAGQMTSGDGLAANNYFGRLRQVLRWQSNDPVLDHAYRHVAERYWSELNRWLVREEGERGIPTAYSLAHRHVGLSVSQALVRSSDREKLEDFFQVFGFTPGSQVAPVDLVPLLDYWIKQAHCPVSASLARLWSNGQARSRIAEVAAVALSSWDGSVNDGGNGRPSASGRLHLTLELGLFPRKRFTVSALLYVPQPQLGRTVQLLTAEPTSSVDLVPDIPGALGLAPGSSLHPEDVVAGVLRVRDDYSGMTLERCPRRLVAFREDELSRRWVEVQQILLGDDLRLLVEDGLAPRVAEILALVARPGWEPATPPYPGQPDGWTLFTGVEILNHPGSLIPANKMDDLSALIPLTASTLKVSGGFAIPGSVRGKWHTALPPEIRAVSDAPGGFVVRLVQLDRWSDEFEERHIAEWSDAGRGVIIEHLRGLHLPDGDYRIELVPSDRSNPSSSTMLYLRSGDSRDERQWHLAESISYGPGIGALGVASDTDSMSIQGHAVFGSPDPSPTPRGAPPRAPSWSKDVGTRRREAQPMRITTPDSDSCIRTGRHRQEVETVELDSKGRPTKSWVYGRCKTCGLVKRYPTRIKARRAGAESAEPREAQPMHDLTGLSTATTSSEERDWTVALDTLQHLGGGTLASLEKVALQIEPTGLFVDQFARTLEALGHISIRRDERTLRPAAWEISPTQLTGCATGRFAFNGYWPAALYNEVADAIEVDGADTTVDGKEPPQYFATQLGNRAQSVADECEVAVIPDAWRALAAALPPMSTILEQLPRQSASADGDISWFDVVDASWKRVDNYEGQGAYRIRKFATLDVVRSAEDLERGTFARCPVQLSKHLAALTYGRPLAAYDANHEVFMVPIGAELPGLYGRALTAASCLPPVVVHGTGAVAYRKVPEELATRVFDLLTR